MKDKTYLYIGFSALILASFLLFSKMYKNKKQEHLSFLAEESSEIFIRDHSPRFGNKDAKVFLIEYLDPECESCRVFYPKIKELLKKYEDKVQLVVRYAPFHGNSKIAIRALEAARAQGKYWEAIELLFKRQPEWGDHHNPRIEMIFEILPEVGLDMDELKKEMNNPKYDDIINTDLSDLRILDVRGTPTFFVNGKIPGGFGIEYLEALIKSEISRLY
tara:strand:+ start:1329 stop:1982 length:654 start_codon:yes stop_codon:yes gene_type:complete